MGWWSFIYILIGGLVFFFIFYANIMDHPERKYDWKTYAVTTICSIAWPLGLFVIFGIAILLMPSDKKLSRRKSERP